MKKILMTLTLAMAAMIAIPTTINAQDTKPQQKTECCKGKKECEKEGKACANGGKACAKDGKACAKDCKSCANDGKACAKDCKSCTNDGKACAKDGKSCAKDGKACSKDGKACGMNKKHKAKSGKMMKGQRDFKGSRENAKIQRKGGENPMFKGITLSEEQQAKMKALREKNMTAEKKTKADMKAKSKEEMQKLHADFDKEVEKILDKDQLKQYQANKAEIEARRAEKLQNKQNK